MQYRSVKGFSGPAALGVFLASLGAGFILAGSAQIIMIMSMLPPGTDFSQTDVLIKKILSNPQHATFAILMQAVATVLLMFFPARLFSLLVYGRGWHWLGFSRHISLLQAGLAFLIILSANFIAVPFDQLSRSILSHFPSLYQRALEMESDYASNVELLGSLRSFSGFFIGLSVVAFLPAFFEETFFRGAFQNLLVRWWGRPLLAILTTSVIFSLIHISLFLFIGRAILGFALGLIFYHTRNVWVNITAHFLNNAFAFSQMFMGRAKAVPVEEGSGNVRLDWMYAAAAVIALYFMFRYLKKASDSQVLKIEEKENLLQSQTLQKF